MRHYADGLAKMINAGFSYYLRLVHKISQKLAGFSPYRYLPFFALACLRLVQTYFLEMTTPMQGTGTSVTTTIPCEDEENEKGLCIVQVLSRFP